VIIDTSVLIAILSKETGSRMFVAALHEGEPRRISAASYLEAAIVIDRSPDSLARTSLDGLVNRLGIIVEPVTHEQARIAREAYRQFGKGTGHPARLNFGDCFVYALAKDKDESLLFKGNDFAQTDIPYVGRRAERRRLSELIAAYG
jgi:ribonuclease VapC